MRLLPQLIYLMINAVRYAMLIHYVKISLRLLDLVVACISLDVLKIVVVLMQDMIFMIRNSQSVWLDKLRLLRHARLLHLFSRVLQVHHGMLRQLPTLLNLSSKKLVIQIAHTALTMYSIPKLQQPMVTRSRRFASIALPMNKKSFSTIGK